MNEIKRNELKKAIILLKQRRDMYYSAEVGSDGKRYYNGKRITYTREHRELLSKCRRKLSKAQKRAKRLRRVLYGIGKGIIGVDRALKVFKRAAKEHKVGITAFSLAVITAVSTVTFFPRAEDGKYLAEGQNQITITTSDDREAREEFFDRIYYNTSVENENSENVDNEQKNIDIETVLADSDLKELIQRLEKFTLEVEDRGDGGFTSGYGKFVSYEENEENKVNGKKYYADYDENRDASGNKIDPNAIDTISQEEAERKYEDSIIFAYNRVIEAADKYDVVLNKYQLNSLILYTYNTGRTRKRRVYERI